MGRRGNTGYHRADCTYISHPCAAFATFIELSFHWYLHLTQYISTRAIHYDLQRSFLSRYIDVRKLASGTVGVMHSYLQTRHESFCPSREGSKAVPCQDYGRFSSECTSDTRSMTRQFSRERKFYNKDPARNLTEWAVLQINSSELLAGRYTFRCKRRKLF